ESPRFSSSQRDQSIQLRTAQAEMVRPQTGSRVCDLERRYRRSGMLRPTRQAVRRIVYSCSTALSVQPNSALERTSARRAGKVFCQSNERAEAAQLGTLGGPKLPSSRSKASADLGTIGAGSQQRAHEQFHAH